MYVVPIVSSQMYFILFLLGVLIDENYGIISKGCDFICEIQDLVLFECITLKLFADRFAMLII